MVEADLVPRSGRYAGRMVHRESIQDSIQMGYAISLYFFGSIAMNISLFYRFAIGIPPP